MDTNNNYDTKDTSAHILSLADQCVKCGLCLPQCPTYNLSANENESPRGRIALIQGWLSGQLEPSEKLTQHLDQCLLCRRCERICPSQVPYGEIMDQSRARLKNNPAIQRSKWSTTFKKIIVQRSLKLLINKKFSTPFIFSLWLLQKSQLLFIAEKSGLVSLLGLKRLNSFLPTLEAPHQPKNFYASSTSPAQGTVALFTGCLSNNIDAKTLKASISLLNKTGFNVYVPKQQTCCGALHMHEGDATQALNFARQNIALFNKLEVTNIVSLVNGCSSQLREFSQLDIPQKFNAKVQDLIEFLAGIKWPENMVFKPNHKAVALQIPCSLQNILRAEDKLLSLLEKIPGIKLPPENIYNKCCGAAGAYFLNQPAISQKLQAAAVESLGKSQPDTIISSNIGCALQLKAGLKQNNQAIDVVHPILLLDQHTQLTLEN